MRSIIIIFLIKDIYIRSIDAMWTQRTVMKDYEILFSSLIDNVYKMKLDL
jgi:hypothetical protein